MLFSVVIPVYNCKNTLADTVQSVLRSGLTDYEILLIDDGSKDGTGDICDALEKQQDKVRCIHQRNTGVSGARNSGIENARGEYILFFDADDSVDAGALAHGAELVALHRPDMLIFGLTMDYYFHGKLYRRDELTYSREGLLNREQWKEAFPALYACNALSPVWNKFIKRQLLMENDLRFRGNLIEMEDFLFVTDCLCFCDQIYMLPEAVYRYRQAENERSTFHRLLRIPSLTAYMQPFEEGLDALAKSLNGESAQTIVGLTSEIYVSLFYEQLRFASVTQIESAAKDMLSGEYAQTVRNENPRLFGLLKDGKYLRVWLQRRKARIRHWLAVRIKYAKSLRRK